MFLYFVKSSKATSYASRPVRIGGSRGSIDPPFLAQSPHFSVFLGLESLIFTWLRHRVHLPLHLGPIGPTPPFFRAADTPGKVCYGALVNSLNLLYAKEVVDFQPLLFSGHCVILSFSTAKKDLLNTFMSFVNSKCSHDWDNIWLNEPKFLGNVMDWILPLDSHFLYLGILIYD